MKTALRPRPGGMTMPIRSKAKHELRLGTVLKMYRAHQEISLRHLAKDIGIPPGTLHYIETGNGMDGSNLVKILNWLMSAK